MKTQPKIDDIDVKILKALLRDARTNFADIAKECNLSITAISQRYRKMKQNGIITGTILMINPKNSRSQHFISIDIKAESSYETSIIEAIKKLPRVGICYRVIGKYDIHASAIIDALEQIDQIKNTIKKQKGVLKIEIGTGLYKYCSFPENLVLAPTKDVNNG